MTQLTSRSNTKGHRKKQHAKKVPIVSGNQINENTIAKNWSM